MIRESPTDDKSSTDKNRSDSVQITSDYHQVEPQRFAEPFIATRSDGTDALRLVADPRGEWVESDRVIEVQR